MGRQLPAYGLLATAVDCVIDSVITNRLTRVMGHHYRGGSAADVTRGIGNLEGNSVHASIAAAFALGAQLNGLAIVGNNYVVERIAVARTVFRFIAGYLLDNYIAQGQTRVAAIARPCHKIR